MKMKDYNSSDVTLKRKNVDKWHRFSKVVDTAVTTQGWTASKLKTIDSTFNLYDAAVTGAFNNNGAADAHLTLTASGAANATVFAGDVLTITTPANKVLTLTVQSVDNTSANAVIQFVQFVGDVNSTALLGTTAVTAVPLEQVLKEASPEELSATVAQSVQTIDSISINAHGIPIYNGFNSLFYNAYLPYHYGGPNVQVPQDRGALMIPFNLYPGTYQPSGHINVSRAREFYITYTSSVIGTDGQVGTLVICASAINFLLISDGSAVKNLSAANRQLPNNVIMHTYLDKQCKHNTLIKNKVYNCLVLC
jgi:hypothetical protein